MPEKSEEAEIQHIIAEAKAYIQKNALFSSEGRNCVDGRNEGSGKLARPAGDLGYVMILMALNERKHWGLSPVECVDIIYKVLRTAGTTFSFHTDHLADPLDQTADPNNVKPIIGCAHGAKATDPNNSEAYGIDPAAMTDAINYVRSPEFRENEGVKMLNLPGHHGEKGVLRNKGLLKTVRPHDDKSMYFIYDEIRDEIFTRDVLIPGLNTQLLGRIQAPIEYNEVRHVSDRQLGATLGLIAKGAPIIDFNVDGPEPKIEYAGRVLILIE